MIKEVFKNSPRIRSYRVTKSRCQSDSMTFESEPRARRGQPAHATRAMWWPYNGAGPTGQANAGNKAARRCCPPSLARIRAPVPHFASLSPRQSKATPHRAITAELRQACMPPSQRHSPIARAHRLAISSSTSSNTHCRSPSQGKRPRASPPSPHPHWSATELAVAAAMLHRAISLMRFAC